MQLLRQLTPSQTLAVIDLALDIKPDWARRVLLGLPPARHDHDEQHDPEVGLDRLVEHMSSHHWWADATCRHRPPRHPRQASQRQQQ